MKPCKYCGFVASRQSDEDCPVIKINKQSTVSVSIPIERALEIVKDNINHNGSRETGTYVNIPTNANWEIVDGELKFLWSENS